MLAFWKTPLKEVFLKKSTKKTEKNSGKTKKEKSSVSFAGRPSLLEEKAPLIYESLRLGNTNRGASYSAGITDETFYAWYRTGKKDLEAGVETKYSVFSLKVDESVEAAKSYALECWRKHMPDDWKAAMAYLERRDRDNYAPKQVMEVAQTVEVTQKALLEVPDNKRRNVKDD